MNIKFPLAKETINQDDINALIEWLKTNPRLTMAELTKEFEQKWANYIGTSLKGRKGSKRCCPNNFYLYSRKIHRINAKYSKRWRHF